MLVYLSLLVFIMLDFAFEYYMNKKGILSKETKPAKILKFIFKYRVLTIAALVFVSTFRAVGVGGDTEYYHNYYQNLKVSTENFNDFDIGFSSFNYLFSVILNLDFRFLYFTTSRITKAVIKSLESIFF